MRNQISKTIKLKRNTETAHNAIVNRHRTVSTDSVFGRSPETAMLNVQMVATMGDGSLRAVLAWEFRENWKLEVHEPGSVAAKRCFNVYERVSHKYWLRGLIRRHR